jgi:hypothetical protein
LDPFSSPKPTLALPYEEEGQNGVRVPPSLLYDSLLFRATGAWEQPAEQCDRNEQDKGGLQQPLVISAISDNRLRDMFMSLDSVSHGDDSPEAIDNGAANERCYCRKEEIPPTGRSADHPQCGLPLDHRR